MASNQLCKFLLRRSANVAVSQARQIHPEALRLRYNFGLSLRPVAVRSTSTPFARKEQLRWHSATVSTSKMYQYNDIKCLSEKPSEDITLIDVREPHEYNEGYIPSAINIPVKSRPDALLLPEEEFEDMFGVEKPSADKEVVFYCKSGVRSNAAAEIAKRAGYERIGEYRGSWLDWTANGGKVGR